MKKYLLTGGGTLGSVTPLLAIRDALQQQAEAEFVFVGTHAGVERTFVEQQYGIRYIGIASGKLRRYMSIQNLIDPLKIIGGFWQSVHILRAEKPDAVITAGSFVSVPLIIAAAYLKIPIFVHQLDLRIGLANKIMARYATKITVSFEELIEGFASEKTVFTGTPIREEIFRGAADKIRLKYNLDAAFPTVLVLGGGLGARYLNEIVDENKAELLKNMHILHATGRDKQGQLRDEQTAQGTYIVREFFADDFADMLAVADVVVTRAGLATLAELRALSKKMIMVPIKGHQQEDNAEFFTKKGWGVTATEQEIAERGQFAQRIIEQVRIHDVQCHGVSTYRNAAQLVAQTIIENS